MKVLQKKWESLMDSFSYSKMRLVLEPLFILGIYFATFWRRFIHMSLWKSSLCSRGYIFAKRNFSEPSHPRCILTDREALFKWPCTKTLGFRKTYLYKFTRRCVSSCSNWTFSCIAKRGYCHINIDMRIIQY